MKYIFILISIFCFSFLSASASKDYILLISSCSSDYPWSQSIEKSFRTQITSSHIPLNIYSEYLNSDIFSSPEIWTQRMKLILEHYAVHPPRILILLSDEAWMAYRKINNEQLKNIPVILAGVKNFGLDLDKYKNKKELKYTDLIPTSQLCKEFNAFPLIQSINVLQTLDLMLQLQPDLKEIVVIGDNRFYGIYATLMAQKTLENYPDLKATYLDGRFITTDSLYTALKHLSPQTSILLSTWNQDVTENSYSYETVHHTICSLAQKPIYVLADFGEKNTKYMGGFYSNTINHGKELAEATLQILTPSESSHPLQVATQVPGIHLNESLMKEFDLDASAIPSKQISYYNRVPSFVNTHRTLLLILSFALGSITVLFFLIFTTSQITFYRKKLDISRHEINTSFSNQQHLLHAIRTFLQEKTEKEAVQKILSRMLQELKADRAYIFEFDPVHQVNSNTYEVCSENTPPQIDSLQNISNREIPWLHGQMEKDHVLVIDDLHSCQGMVPDKELQILLDQKIRSLLIAPLYVNNALWGYVGIDFVYNKKKFGEQEMVYIETLSQILCIGIGHFRSEARNYQSQKRVTELESLFSYASDHACVGVAQWNPFTKEGFATEQWFKNLGETSRNINEVIHTYQYMHPEDREKLIAFIEKASIGEAKSLVKAIRIKSMGEWHWYKYHATLRNYDPQNQSAELVFLSIDIDNLKKIENNLILAKARAEESDRLKSAFIANMSHEIRTPLNAIIGFSSLLAMDPDLRPEEKTEYAHMISINNELLLQLINDILDISKIEAGVLDFNKDIVDLNPFFKEIESLYTLRNQEIEIKFIQDSEQSVMLPIDRTRLNQVITNFLNNAFKFTKTGYIHFGYHLQENEVYFYVEDTGIGIPKNKLHAIFQRFVKLNPFIQGTGLGLSICSTIVEKFGGRIGAESEEGKGSRFWFTVPYLQK